MEPSKILDEAWIEHAVERIDNAWRDACASTGSGAGLAMSSDAITVASVDSGTVDLSVADVQDTVLMLACAALLDHAADTLRADLRQLREVLAAEREAGCRGGYALDTGWHLDLAMAVFTLQDALTLVSGARSLARTQFSGTSGTLAEITDRLRRHGVVDPIETVHDIIASASVSLGLQRRPPWHQSRAPIEATLSALRTTSAAWDSLGPARALAATTSAATGVDDNPAGNQYDRELAQLRTARTGLLDSQSRRGQALTNLLERPMAPETTDRDPGITARMVRSALTTAEKILSPTTASL